MPRLVELEATFPRIAETVGPFSRVAIAFVPDVFFSPQPALFTERKNQLQHVDVAFAIVSFFFDIQDEGAGWLQYAVKLFASRQEPRHILVGPNATVRLASLVSVGWRGHYQIESVVFESLEDFGTVSTN